MLHFHAVSWPTTSYSYVGYTITRTISFNITSISDEEDISMAELRLYLTSDQHVFRTGGNKTSVGVSIFDIFASDSIPSNGEMGPRQLLVTRYFDEKALNGWETFSVTDAVRRVYRTTQPLLKLEIRIKATFQTR